MESVDRSSVLEESVSTGVCQRPGDLVGRVSLIPLDLKLGIGISVRPGQVERSDSRESKFLKEGHLSGLATHFAA